ncbi:hypothetical protein EV2_019657 [Malus domestica]
MGSALYHPDSPTPLNVRAKKEGPSDLLNKKTVAIWEKEKTGKGKLNQRKAIQMAECIYDLDGLEDLPESLELVEFSCAEPDKPVGNMP